MTTAKKQSPYRWVVLGTIIIFMFCCNYVQFQISPLALRLMDEYGFTFTQYSRLFTAPLVPAIFLAMISGALCDRFGLRIPIAIAVGIGCIGGILHIFVKSYPIFFISMLMIGMGQTFTCSNIVKLLERWFDFDKVPMVTGIYLASVRLAQCFGMLSGTLFKSVKSAFFVSGLLAACACLLWIIFMRDNKDADANEVTTHADDTIAKKQKPIKTVITSRAIWLIAFSMFFYLPNLMGVPSVLPTALEVRGFSASSTAVVAFLYSIGGFAGNVLMPPLMQKLKRTRLWFFIFTVLTVVGTVFGWLLNNQIIMCIVLFLVGAFSNGVTGLITTLPIYVPEIGPKLAGTAGGFVISVQQIGAVVLTSYVFAPLCGENYVLHMALLGLCVLISAIIIPFLPVRK